MTRTYAKLAVSQQAFDEIRAKLVAAGYGDQVDTDKALVDMHGIALVSETPGEDSDE